MKTQARVAGLLYLISIVTRIVADGFVRDGIVVSRDAATTAKNILANEDFFRLGFTADMVAFASYIALAAVLYHLFKPVNASLSLAASYFGLSSAITQAVSSLFHLAPLYILSGAESLRVFSPEQLNALALLSLRLRAIAYHNLGLVFLGFYCFLLGWLVLKSNLMPRFVGVLIVLAGLAYFPFLWPPLVARLLPYLLIPAGVGQITFTLWLLIMGVKEPRAN
jgi:Domain of unknown function (DUF4386)